MWARASLPGLAGDRWRVDIPRALDGCPATLERPQEPKLIRFSPPAGALLPATPSPSLGRCGSSGNCAPRRLAARLWSLPSPMCSPRTASPSSSSRRGCPPPMPPSPPPRPPRCPGGALLSQTFGFEEPTTARGVRTGTRARRPHSRCRTCPGRSLPTASARCLRALTPAARSHSSSGARAPPRSLPRPVPGPTPTEAAAETPPSLQGRDPPLRPPQPAVAPARPWTRSPRRPAAADSYAPRKGCCAELCGPGGAEAWPAPAPSPAGTGKMMTRTKAAPAPGPRRRPQSHPFRRIATRVPSAWRPRAP